MKQMTESATPSIDAVATLTPVIADANDQLPDRIHLLRAGKFNTKKYGTLEITASDLQEMVDNFKKGIGLPFDGSTGAPVNFAHQIGLEAAAWIKSLEFDGRNLWGTAIEWSTSGADAIKGKRYKCFSSEFNPRCWGAWSNPENADHKVTNVFTGGALTNIPMFAGNRPIMASAELDNDSPDDKQVIYISASDKEIPRMTLDQVRGKAAADLTEEEKNLLVEKQSELTDDEQVKFGFKSEVAKVVDEVIEDKNKETVEVETPAIKPEAAAVAASIESGEMVGIQASEWQAVQTQLNELRRKDVASRVTKHVERGAIKADAVDKWVDRIMVDGAMEDVLGEMNGNETVTASEIGNSTKAGDATVTATEKIMASAKKLVEDGKAANVGEAIGAVMASDADLAAEYSNETKLV